MSGIGFRPSHRLSMQKHQAPKKLNQAAPVQNTYYTIMEEVDARIEEMHFGVEDTNETLQVKVTIDGETITSDAYAATHSTSYGVIRNQDAITRTEVLEFDSSPAHFEKYRSYMMDGHSVKVEVRKTTTAGTGNLVGIVSWNRKEWM